MDFRGGSQWAGQRFVGALRHRNAGDTTQLEQAQVVRANLLYPNISTGRGDADHVGVRAGQQVYQRKRVIDTGVDIDEDRRGFGPQWIPGTSRIALRTGRGTPMRPTARTGRLGRRRTLFASLLTSETPRAAAESGYPR